MDVQSRVLSRAVHVTPESVEVWICAPCATAARCVPLAEEATDIQLRLAGPVRAVHVTPALVEV